MATAQRPGGGLQAAGRRARTSTRRGQAGEDAAANSLLAIKLAIPPIRSALALRPHLTDRLQAAVQGKLTLVAAPAGYGKTTLLAQWHATRMGQGVPLAWVSLDSGDNDPIRFWRYVVMALERLHSGT